MSNDVKNNDEKVIKYILEFYCPLVVKKEEENSFNLEECDNYTAVIYEEEIQTVLDDERKREGYKDVTNYFDGSKSLKDKLGGTQWTVKSVNGILYGCIHLGVTEPLTDEEILEWKRYLHVQCSDGFGEVFEQRPIKTEEGDLFVSFWNNDPDYFLYEEDEFREYLNNGMEGLSL